MKQLKQVFILLILFSVNSTNVFAQIPNTTNYSDTTVATVINRNGGTKRRPYALYEFYANGHRYVAKGKAHKGLIVGEQFTIAYNKVNPYENKILNAAPFLDGSRAQLQTKGVVFSGNKNYCLFGYTIIDQEGNTKHYEKRQIIDKSQTVNSTQPYLEGVEYTVRYPVDDPARGIIYLNSKIEANNTEALIYYYKGIHAFNEHHLKSSLVLLNKAIQADNNFSQAYYMRGLVNNQLNNESAASDDFSKAIDLNPNSWEAHYQKGLLYIQEKDYDSALGEFQKAESLNTHANDIIYVSIGEAYYLKGMYNESEIAFTKAIEINPTDSVNYYNRALVKIHNTNNMQAGQTDLLDAEHNGFKKAGRVLRSNNTNHTIITNNQKIPEKPYFIYSLDYTRFPYRTYEGSFSTSFNYGVSGLSNSGNFSTQTFSTSATFTPVNQVSVINIFNLEYGSYTGAYGGMKFGLSLANSRSNSFDIGGGYNFNLKPIPQHIIRIGADFSYMDQLQVIGGLNNYNQNLTINNTNFNYITVTHTRSGTSTHYHNITYVSFFHEVYSLKPKVEFWMFPRDQFSLRFSLGYNIQFAQINSIHFYQSNDGNTTKINISDPSVHFQNQGSVPIQNLFNNNGLFFSIGAAVRLNKY